MSKEKKYSIVLGVLLILGINIYCYATESGVITGQTVKLREKPTTESKSISLLDLNDKVEILGKEGDWYQVKIEGKTGYVSASYIKTDAKIENNNIVNNVTNSTALNSSENNNISSITKIENNEIIESTNTSIKENEQEEIELPSEQELKEDIQIRIIPLINAGSIGELKKGTKVTVTEKINNWFYIISEEYAGWTYKEVFVSSATNTRTDEKQEDKEVQKDQKVEEVEKTNIQNRKGYVNVDSVNIRKSADIASEVLGNLSKNAEVIILEEVNSWYKIKTATKEGYIAKQYISDTKVEITNRSSDFERKEEKNEDIIEVSSNKTEIGEKVIAYAKQYLGCRYVSGGNGPNSFDCSGLTRYVYQNFGYSLARTAAGQAGMGKNVNKSELQLGDLVFFSQGTKEIGHVGIYVGGNSFIHAANPQKGVVITPLSNSYYIKNYVTARRIL